MSHNVTQHPTHTLASLLRLAPSGKHKNLQRTPGLYQHLTFGPNHQDEFLVVQWVLIQSKWPHVKISPEEIDSLDLPDSSVGTNNSVNYSALVLVSQPMREQRVLHCFLQECKSGWPVLSSLQQFLFAVSKTAFNFVETNWKHCKEEWMFPIKQTHLLLLMWVH